MTRKERRLTLIGVAGGVLAIALGLILFFLNNQIVYFQSPTDIIQQAIPKGERIRLGGLVEEGSVERSDDAQVLFRVTDTTNAIAVTYTGILPDLFREGQGVVTEGFVGPDGVFVASRVLAKHDENYIPKEVADALKEQGHWLADEEAAN